MKKKTLLIIIITLIILLLIAGGVFAYLFFATDLFKTDKQLFLKYAVSMGNNKNETNILENYEKKKRTTAYENNGNFIVNTEVIGNSSDLGMQMLQSVITPSNNTNITFSGKVDNANRKVEQNIQINYSETVNFPFTFKQDGDIYGVKSDLITQNYIAVENNNLKELFQKLGTTDVTSIPDKIEVQELQSMGLTGEEKNHLLNTYVTPMVNGLSDEKFSKTENADGSVEYILTLTYQDLKNIGVQILNTLSTDTMMINKINTALQDMYQNENMLLTTENIKETATNLNEKTVEDGNATISVTQKEGMTTGIRVDTADIIIKLTRVQDTSSAKYNISLKGKDTREISLQVSYSGLNTNIVTENISVTANIPDMMNVSYSFNNTVTFGNAVNIETMDMTKTAVLNNYPAEQLQPFMTQLGNVITQVNTNQMKQIGYPTDMVNPMAMWVVAPGLLQQQGLINRAQEAQKQQEEAEREMNEIMTNSEAQINEILSGMADDSPTNLADTEIKANNSEYESYKGQISGSKVKALCQKVRSNNLAEPSQKINVKLGQSASATSFLTNVNDVNTLINNISPAKTYNITLSYDTTTKFVCEIGIEEIN